MPRPERQIGPAPLPLSAGTCLWGGSAIYASKNRGQLHIDEGRHPAGVRVNSLHVCDDSKGPMPPSSFLAALRVRPLKSSLRKEIELWYGLIETSQDGPWSLPKNFAVEITRAAWDASVIAWGGVLRFVTLVFKAGANFDPQRILRHFQVKIMYILHEALQEFCKAFLGRLSHAQMAANADNSIVVQNVRNRRRKDATVHSLLRALFELQMRDGLLLRLG